MTARRISGSVGLGGPASDRCFFPPRHHAEPPVLQVSKSDAAHQRMAMQPGPRSPLESAKPKLLLELLVRLLAHPSCLDGRGETRQRRARRQIAEMVFPLTAAAPLANQPDLFAGQVAVT